MIKLFSLISQASFQICFQGEDDSETHRWVQQLKNQSKNLGVWWRRRNAVPDIKSNNEEPCDTWDIS